MGKILINMGSYTPKRRSSSSQRSEQKCKFCINHSISIPKRNHKLKCSYKNCSCILCENVRIRQQKTAESIKQYRAKISSHGNIDDDSQSTNEEKNISTILKSPLLIQESKFKFL